MTSDPDTWSRVRAGLEHVDTPMLGGMFNRRYLAASLGRPGGSVTFPSLELDYATIERRLWERMKTPPARMQRLASWMFDMTDEPVPGMPDTWRRVPRALDIEAADLSEPDACVRLMCIPYAGPKRRYIERVTFRVSAELVQLVSPRCP